MKRQGSKPVRGGHGGDQHAQDIDHNDICLAEAKQLEQVADSRTGRQDQKGFQQISPRKMQRLRLRTLGAAVCGRGFIRDDIDIQIGRGVGQPLRQGRLAKKFSPDARAPHHNFGNAREPCKFRDLEGDIIPIYRFNGRPHLLRKVDIAAQLLLVCLAHGGKPPAFLRTARLSCP